MGGGQTQWFRQRNIVGAALLSDGFSEILSPELGLTVRLDRDNWAQVLRSSRLISSAEQAPTNFSGD